MRRISLDQFISECRSQGVPREHIAAKCPICGTVQSMMSLILRGVAGEMVERYFAFTCIGRFDGRGAWQPGDVPGRGCDWTLGGLFQLHKLEVLTSDGVAHPRFELATAEESQQLMAANERRSLIGAGGAS